MPVNKAARFRFEIIDSCLRNSKKKWSKAEILKYINRRLELQFGDGHIISISQLRYDLENMQSECNAPIEMYKVGKAYYYRYDDPDFSIKNIPINEDEIAKLNIAVQVLRQIKGFTIADEIADIVSKLESRYNFNVVEHKNIIIFGNDQNAPGKETLEDIYYAIIRKNVLKIAYSTDDAKEPEAYNLHPYLLKEYDKVWYIVGYCDELQTIGSFELGRMAEIKISKLTYFSDAAPSIDNYFDNIIGVSKPNDDVCNIRLIFSEQKSHHILAYPIHHSQKIIKHHANGKLEISLNIIINQEFIDVLLGYGQHVKVLSPTQLVSEIAEIAEKLSLGYKISG